MLGILLKEIRKSKEISQEILVEGICTRETLKKYESGKCDLEKLRADALIQRLEKTVDKYYVKLDNVEYALARKRVQIQDALRRNKLSVAERAILAYREMPGTNDALHRQFLAFVWAELLRKKSSSLSQQREVILAGIAETLAGRELSINLLTDRLFHLLELFLLQRYAIVLEEMGEVEEAIRWYEALLARFSREQRGMADKQKLYPLIAYRLAKYWMEEGRCDLALPVIEKAIELLRYSKIQNTLYLMLRELEIAVKEEMGTPVLEEERENFYCLKKFLEKGKNSENFFPIYVEPHLCSINAILKERRIIQGKTREELVGIICDPRTLERQEKNQSKPQKRVWKSLFSELGLSSLKYEGSIITRDYKDFQKFEAMVRAYNKGNIKEAMTFYQELVKILDRNEFTNRQFVKYWGAELPFGMGKISREERNQRFWEMMGETLSLKNKEKSFSCWLTKYEKEALDSIAWDCEGEEIEEILPLLKRQFCRNFNVAERIMERGFYEKVLYNIARGYLSSGNLWRAEQYITLAMEQRRFQDWGLSWNRIFFLRFRIEEKKLGLWEKKIPLKDNVTAFQWAKLAWASAKENKDTHMCEFIIGYFKRHYLNEGNS